MAEKIIDSTAYRANIRKRKEWGDQNVLWNAPNGTPFEITDSMSSSIWTEGTFLKDGKLMRGFVYHTVVRDPVGEVKEDLIRECIKWFEKFDYGRGQENQLPFSDYIGKFWNSVGYDWDGTDTNIPWFAAFISYVLRIAGGYTGFKFSLRHSDYIHYAITSREDERDAPFWGYRLDEIKPKVGDLICLWRGTQVDYEYARRHDRYTSHCDIIISIKNGKAYTIGGNVGQSVGRKIFALDQNGFFPPSRNAFAILRNRR